MEKQDDSYGMREITGYLLISHPAFPSAQLYGASDFIFPYEPSKQWFMHWRRKWQPTPVFLPEESQGRGSLVGCRLWGRTELDTTEVT